MSKREKLEAGIIPGQEMGEKFMAVLLWSQTSNCKCPACLYLRELGTRMIKTHVGAAEQVG